MAKKILGVLGGKDLPLPILQAWCQGADLVYGADSGADQALAAGAKPIVVGDLDSFAGDGAGLRIVHVPDQDETDCDKMLSLMRHEGHSSVTLCGLEGDRIDHQFASLASCARAVNEGMEIRLIFRTGFGYFAKSGAPWLHGTDRGQRVSLIPIGKATLSSEGLKWELRESTLDLQSNVSISNRATGPISLWISEGTLLIITEQDVSRAWMTPSQLQ